MILTILVAFLVWEVITRSIAAYLADTSPEAAIRLWSTNPTALLNLADAKLNAARFLNRSKPLVMTRWARLSWRSGQAQPAPDPNRAPGNQSPDVSDQSPPLSPQGSIPGRPEIEVRNKCSDPLLG